MSNVIARIMLLRHALERKSVKQMAKKNKAEWSIVGRNRIESVDNFLR